MQLSGMGMDKMELTLCLIWINTVSGKTVVRMKDLLKNRYIIICENEYIYIYIYIYIYYI